MSFGGRRIEISGTVQGVGFRPWIYRLAQSAGLSGSVRNDPRGVTIEAFGPEPRIESFLEQLETSPPPAASIRRISWQDISTSKRPGAFAIVESLPGSEREVSIPPDLATCPDCVAEIFDPSDRRYRYPFTNCTNCGPRLTITLDLPYDRPATTMAGFAQCTACQAEYTDPGNRRFHAQPNACPVCGPTLELWSAAGECVERQDRALVGAAHALAAGRILAAKGLGGFHLMVDARNAAAVESLRERKHRPAKPLALMVPNLGWAQRLCEMTADAQAVLSSAAAPIVLLRKASSLLAPTIAPDTPYFGVMLPSTPLHHLLLAECGFPLVATSGNLSDEPISIDNDEAASRLRTIADLFLVHDRPIERHADDSIVFVAAGRPRVLRRARGYAPAPITLARRVETILGVGAHMKSSVALGVGERVFISQHIGDMETTQAVAAFESVISDFLRMLRVRPVAVAHDLHPGYPSTLWAERAVAGHSPAEVRELLEGIRAVPVQHHHAHLTSCLAENGVEGPALGVTWDGTGYGTDGTIWGGEFLLGDATGFERVAHLRPFPLAGGSAAVREPRRTALALLWPLYGEALFEREELAPVASIPAAARRILSSMLETGIQSPLTTSAGRLFDGVAALLDLHQRVSFEGQAAMALETAASLSSSGRYPMPIGPGDDGAGSAAASPLVLDWRPTIEAILEEMAAGADVDTIAARFHNTLAGAVAEVATTIGVQRVALTGGCFQNRLLTERTQEALEALGFEVLLHREVPPNDGGISLGQVSVAAASLASGKED